MSSADQQEQAGAFECRQCGACCRWPGHVLMTGDEVQAIADFLGMPVHAFTERFARLAVNRACLSLVEAQDGACIFLEGNACRIQPVKPQQCRDFPLRWSVKDARIQCAALRNRGPVHF